MDFMPTDSLTAIVGAQVAETCLGAGLVLVAVLAIEVITACPSAFANAVRGCAVQVLVHLEHLVLAASLRDRVLVLRLRRLHHHHRIVLRRILHRFFILRAGLFLILRHLPRKILRIF